MSSPATQVAEVTGATARGEVGEVDLVAQRFASRSVPEHVVRGVLGLLLAVAAFALAGSHPVSMLLLVPAVVAWRGCPTCWLLGLGETLRRAGAGRSGRAQRS